jgi:hypothetical protein
MGSFLLGGILLSYTWHTQGAHSYADRQTNGIYSTKEHARFIPAHYTNSALNNTNTNTLVVDSNNTRINIKPLNQIHCSLYGLTRALAIASQYISPSKIGPIAPS